VIRPAAVAGLFYPRESVQLSAELGEILDGVEHLEPRLGFPKAVIVPHAGYIYSGPVAAHAYDALAPARGIVTRVVLLGPVHRVPVRGLAVPGAQAFATPLGEVPIDRAALESLADLPQVVVSDAAHAQEHSLEVQLPFLQRTLGPFSLVPFAVGDVAPAAVAQVLDRLWGGTETLFVLSTDMSHYNGYDEARRIDRAAILRIGALCADLNHDEACGATPLNGLLLVAKKRGLAIRLLAAGNSGDTAGGKREVVGYSSFGLYEGGEVGLAEAGRTLLAIARASIAQALGVSAEPAPAGAPWLRQAGASFVTLKRGGELRGCIGSLSAERPIAADVAANAQAAAFRDPRFPPLSREEWPQLEVEVSLLSTPKPIRFADEAELLTAIAPGEDGLILECAGRRATFLPQVWEGLPDKRSFLAELVRKAGLPADTRLGRCKVSRYRVANWSEAPSA
jgi:AmmeMemoRadiSam system protein B/AmmeMemoRadiSam system protein A